MRRRISESNTFPQFDLFSEYQKIEYLLSEKAVIGDYGNLGYRRPPQFSLEQYVNDLYFLNWNLRGTFLSISEMRDGLGIAKSSFSRKNIIEEKVLNFIQYAANCNYRVQTTIDKCSVAYIANKDYFKALVDNMKALLGRLHAHFSFDERMSEVFVVYDDDLATVVAAEHPDIQQSIIEYKMIDNSGDLKRKGEILCTLFKRLESIEKQFKGTTYANLCSDTKFLFNKIGARHWVDDDKIAAKTFLQMDRKELEGWYDKTYTLFLSCMVISQYLDVKKDVERIKQSD